MGSKYRVIRPYLIKDLASKFTSEFIDSLIPSDTNIFARLKIGDWIEKGTSFGLDFAFHQDRDNSNQDNIINHPYSFVINIKNVVECEISKASWIYDAKNEYLRFSVDNTESYLFHNKSIMDTPDFISFCIYSTNPLEQKYSINLLNWYSLF